MALNFLDEDERRRRRGRRRTFASAALPSSNKEVSKVALDAKAALERINRRGESLEGAITDGVNNAIIDAKSRGNKPAGGIVAGQRHNKYIGGLNKALAEAGLSEVDSSGIDGQARWAEREAFIANYKENNPEPPKPPSYATPRPGEQPAYRPIKPGKPVRPGKPGKRPTIGPIGHAGTMVDGKFVRRPLKGGI